MTAPDADRGFTLVETLVALAVLGAVVTAVLALVAQSARFVATAEDRMLASMVVDNEMVEALAVSAPLERNRSEKETTFAGAAWTVTREVAETGVGTVVRIDISVRRAGGAQALASATTLKAEQS